MRRRDFLARVPAAASLAPAGGAGAVPAGRAASIITIGRIHPRAEAAVGDLIESLRACNYAVTRNPAAASGTRILIAVANQENQANLSGAGAGSVELLAPERFRLQTRPGLVLVLGGDAKGLVYALSELRRSIGLEKKLPASLSIDRKPVFAVRRWSTAVSHDFGSPWDERQSLAQRLAYIDSDVLKRAGDFGMNSIEINGRPGDGWDVAWVIGFRNYPTLAALFPMGERRQRLELVERVARRSQENLLRFFVWSHELYLPPGFIELYPQVKGIGYPVCLSNEFLKQFIRDKYIEFFEACPSVDGLVMSVNESGSFSLLTDAGCKCDRCIRMSQHDRLMAVLNEVIAAASERKKQIVLRTFQGSSIHDLYGHPELETIRKAYTGLPRHVQIMSKYCPLDFYGGAIADEPLIGAFPNSHLVEFSLDVEWQGRTFVPALTPENFKRRIAHAIEKRCTGIVPRVDFPFPSMEPEPIFGHPNEFNAWYMSELLWNPAAGIDDSLLRWTTLRYGAGGAPSVASALRKTEAITQKTFFCQGQILISYHNMIASVSHCDNFLWGQALSKWDASKRKLSESFFQPDEELIAKAKQEKAEAVALAGAALEELRKARERLPAIEFQRLCSWFEKLRDTAELWSDLTELYLRHRQSASSPAKPELVQAALATSGNETLRHLLGAARAGLGKSVDMERLHGKNSWPVFSPDRGVSAYEFIQEILRHYIGGITGEPVADAIRSKDVDSVLTAPVVRPDSIESFWRALVECGRPGFEIERTTEARVRWPGGLRQVELNEATMQLTANDGRQLALPLPGPVRAVTLSAGDATFRIRKDVEQLTVEAQR